jgi:hypothetical protein
VEQTVRQQMTNNGKLPFEPIGDYGKLLRVARPANETGDLTQLTNAELPLLTPLREQQDLIAPK